MKFIQGNHWIRT